MCIGQGLLVEISDERVSGSEVEQGVRIQVAARDVSKVKIRLELDSLVEIGIRFFQGLQLLRHIMREGEQLQTFLIGDKCLRIAHVGQCHCGTAIVVQEHIQRQSDLLGNVGLYRERVAGIAIVGFRPQVETVVGSNKLCGHSQAVA